MATSSESPVRSVRVLAAGGTISMIGEQGARPALDASALVRAVPELAEVAGLRAESVAALPGAQMSLADALEVAHAARSAAAGGEGVVVTHGTDTLEESALLCDLIYDGDAPIVFTGAIRPASATGADGPANLADAVAVAGSPASAGLGVVVVFAGEIHAARTVRKTDSTSTRPFTSPQMGPVGHVEERRVRILARPERQAALDVPELSHRVEIVQVGLGADGALVQAALDAGADGLVAVALGAGHLPPPALDALTAACARVPVVVTVRPERGTILRTTYGFEGSERDLRASPLIPAGFLSAQGARIKLLVCLGAGMDEAAIRAAFSVDDA